MTSRYKKIKSHYLVRVNMVEYRIRKVRDNVGAKADHVGSRQCALATRLRRLLVTR